MGRVAIFTRLNRKVADLSDRIMRPNECRSETAIQAEAISLRALQAETRDAGNGRGRSPEEKNRARDRAGSHAAFGRRTSGAHWDTAGGDWPARSRHRRQAGLAQRRRSVLQEIAPPRRLQAGLRGAEKNN